MRSEAFLKIIFNEEQVGSFGGGTAGTVPFAVCAQIKDI